MNSILDLIYAARLAWARKSYRRAAKRLFDLTNGYEIRRQNDILLGREEMTIDEIQQRAGAIRQKSTTHQSP